MDKMFGAIKSIMPKKTFTFLISDVHQVVDFISDETKDEGTQFALYKEVWPTLAKHIGLINTMTGSMIPVPENLEAKNATVTDNFVKDLTDQMAANPTVAGNLSSYTISLKYSKEDDKTVVEDVTDTKQLDKLDKLV